MLVYIVVADNVVNSPKWAKVIMRLVRAAIIQTVKDKSNIEFGK